MQINRQDVLWNYAATFLKIASSVLLFPLILKVLPSDKVGIWTIFMTITSFVSLLDFGFNPSFTRNITYIFSGVKTLKKVGYEKPAVNSEVNYTLLKGVIEAMQWFYSRMAFILFIILATAGTMYIKTILRSYDGDQLEIYIAWSLLCLISTYNLYTLYYDSLLQGKGLIKRSKQIIITGQILYLAIAAIFILKEFGLIAIVTAQAFSVLTIRYLSYKAFFSEDIRNQLNNVNATERKEIMDVVYPNAIKIGLTSLGGFLVQKSSLVIGALYISLSELASYGISIQLISIISGIASVYISTFQPQIAQYRINNYSDKIKTVFIKSIWVLILTYTLLGTLLIFVAPWILELINSRTELISKSFLLIALIISILENNHSIAGSILLSKNEVPFFRAAIFSGILNLIILFVLLKATNAGMLIMIIAPGLSQAVYQNWKWPTMVFKELKISRNDLFTLKI